VAPGWVARRVIQPGEPLRPPAVAPAPMILSGRAVRYSVERAGIQLVLAATSLSAGALGDTIPVRLDARRRVLAIVSGPGHVVALPESTR
jgi:flagella basal body P-ring formation protein FlgA